MTFIKVKRLLLMGLYVRLGVRKMRLVVEGIIRMTFPSFRECELRRIQPPADMAETFSSPHMSGAFDSRPTAQADEKIQTVVLRHGRFWGPRLQAEDFKLIGIREVFDIWVGRVGNIVYYAYYVAESTFPVYGKDS